MWWRWDLGLDLDLDVEFPQPINSLPGRVNGARLPGLKCLAFYLREVQFTFQDQLGPTWTSPPNTFYYTLLWCYGFPCIQKSWLLEGLLLGILKTSKLKVNRHCCPLSSHSLIVRSSDSVCFTSTNLGQQYCFLKAKVIQTVTGNSRLGWS